MRFLLDEHLGRLARYLRMLGVDAELVAGEADDVILARGAEAGRLILSRDRELVSRARGGARFVQATEPRAQLCEVLRELALATELRPLSRCLDCNGALLDATPEDVARVPEEARRQYDRFWACSDCAKLYWRGSHYRKMQSFTRDVLTSLDGRASE